MALSEKNNEWNKIALQESANDRRFIQNAVKAGFTLQQAQFLLLSVDMEKFVRNQDLADIFTRPMD